MESRLQAYVKLGWNAKHRSGTGDASPGILSDLALSFWLKGMFDDVTTNEVFYMSLSTNLMDSRVSAFSSQS